MSEDGRKREPDISPEMTVLDVIYRWRQTEDVFRKFDRQAGACICCEALFEPLGEVALRYGLDLERLLADLKAEVDKGRDD